MAFILQLDNGTVDDANAYIDETFFRAYHVDRKNTLPSGSGQTVIEAAIIRATDYIDARFVWKGERARVAQRTGWPRVDADDVDDNLRFGIPTEIEEATADYAFIALSQTLDPTPDRDATGQTVLNKREHLGPIEEETRYAPGGALQLPRYPVADRKLNTAGLTVSRNTLTRS